MRVGVVQFDPQLGEIDRNLETCLQWAREAAQTGCELVVFPECAVSGYMFESRDEALPFAVDVPGAETEAITDVCRELVLYCVVGLLERTASRLFNTAVLCGPDGLVGRYRKTHLPATGVDRFLESGDRFEVFETPVGRIGIAICYELRFPEVTRVLALRGAEIIAHPTNWPLAARGRADAFTRARPIENEVFLLTANRCGIERGEEFFGWSQIVDPTGTRLAEAGDRAAELITAEIDLQPARMSSKVASSAEVLRPFRDRRPTLYAVVAKDIDVPRA
jgi:predicted amidohydrolase